MNEDFVKEFIEKNFSEEDKEQLEKLFNLNDENFELVAPIINDHLYAMYSKPAVAYTLLASLYTNGGSIMELANFRDGLQEGVESMNLSQLKKDFIMNLYDMIVSSITNITVNENNIINIPIEMINENAKIPTYANIGDAGADVYSTVDCTINPGETKLIPLGFKVAVPQGYELQVRPKSGLSLKTKMRIANAPGTIDSGYRDEVGVIVENIMSPILDISEEGSVLFGESFSVSKGQKIAQLVLQKVPVAAFNKVESVESIAGNRNGGFGSTGKF